MAAKLEHSTATARPLRARLPGIVNLVGAVAVIAVVVQLALFAGQASPPAIAEFAPQVQKPIQLAPAEQTAIVGNGQGGAALGARLASPSPSAAIPQGARLSRCVGDPPRQIEDPQSPPCVPYWSGDNGGATAKGVTRDEVRVIMATPPVSAAVTAALQSFFNRRFEFYGRHMNIIAMPSGGSDTQ